MLHFSLQGLRPGTRGISDSFEEFCCQLFRRAPEAPSKGCFKRIRGAGGDGGVEAIWVEPSGQIWGLQAKYFEKFGANQKAQMKESLSQAIANYATLDRYTFCISLSLTARRGAKNSAKISKKKSAAKSKSTTRSSKSGQHEKIETWIAEWKSELAQDGRAVEINFWDESELLSRLTDCDVHGGIRRYWFDETVMSSVWFDRHLKDAKAQAGKRYSPEISIETPLATSIAAFGRSQIWLEFVEVLSKDLDDKIDWWRGTIRGIGGSQSEGIDDKFLNDGQAILDASEIVAARLRLLRDTPPYLSEEFFRDAVLRAIELTATLLPKIKHSLKQKHGDSADSIQFRQFSAEYNAAFPMAPLDHIRNLLKILRKIEELTSSIDGHLPAASTMLICGPAGIGKTHGVLDMAFNRWDADLPSLIFFGEEFSDGDPWTRVCERLGLAAIGREELLDALNAAGERAGSPLIIFIDALNETLPSRGKWRAWLPPMAEQIERRSFLKLCVTCRDTYVGAVIPEQFGAPRVEHNGFMGHEEEALFRFFQHYGLGLPTEPLLQDEFSNPLFLHLTCEALKDCGLSSIPLGRDGIRAILDILLNAKNLRVASECGYDPRSENRIRSGISELARVMASTGSRSISLTLAHEALDAIGKNSLPNFLFDAMERESLISIVAQKDHKLGGVPSYTVRFTFERMGDHFIAEHLTSRLKKNELKGAIQRGGSLHFLFKNLHSLNEHAGLIEAISICVAEQHGIELVDLTTLDVAEIAPSVLNGLQWRDSKSITKKTIGFVRKVLNDPTTSGLAWETIIKLSTRQDHPLNALFLHEFLMKIPMLERDPYWSMALDKWVFPSSHVPEDRTAVHRLIDWSLRGHLEGITLESAKLCATVFSWFCASPNRKVRDRATKGLVRVFKARPDAISPIVREFLRSDDEYISERVLVAAYGALLLCQSLKHTKDCAIEVLSNFFEPPSKTPLNASLRDHGRLIIELAIDIGAVAESALVNFRPPYPSAWPLDIPAEAETNAIAANRNRFPKMELGGSDFARYIVEPRVNRAFNLEDAGLSNADLLRWLLKKAVELGYPGVNDSCAEFDIRVLARHGGGRATSRWAERLGKKYYWILLRRLIGQIADHLQRRRWNDALVRSTENLQSIELRDIDPTDLRSFGDAPKIASQWDEFYPYDFPESDNPQLDSAWVNADDLADAKSSLTANDHEGNPWFTLNLSHSSDGKRRDKPNDSYRRVTFDVHAALCKVGDLGKIKSKFSRGDWSIDLMRIKASDYYGYLGEYPSGLAYRQRYAEDMDFEHNESGIMFEAVVLEQLRGGNWGYDCSIEDGSPNLLMPSPKIIDAGQLRWDGQGGWVDRYGKLQAADPYWWLDVERALLIRLEYLDKFLANSGKALVVLTLQTKSVVSAAASSGGSVEMWTALVRSGGKTIKIGKKSEKFRR
jgi:hypothetical protein